MLRMAFEREVIINIRSRLDAFDEYCAFIKGLSPHLHPDESVTHSHVRLGSLGKIIHFGSFAEMLGKDIGLHDLRTLLTTFLRLNRVSNATDDVISNAEVWIIHLCDRRFTLLSILSTGGPLSCITGYIRLSGDSGEEDRSTPCHNFLARIGGKVRLRHPARLRSSGTGILPSVRHLYDINRTRVATFSSREDL